MKSTTFPKPTITKLIAGRLGLLNPNLIRFNQNQSTLGSLEYLYFWVYFQNFLHLAFIYHAPHNIHDAWEHTWEHTLRFLYHGNIPEYFITFYIAITILCSY